MHHSRVMAGAMTLLLLSAPASWGAAPQKAKAVPTAEPFEGLLSPKALPPRGIWFGGRIIIFGFPSARGAALSAWIQNGREKVVGSIPDVKVGPQA